MGCLLLVVFVHFLIYILYSSVALFAVIKYDDDDDDNDNDKCMRCLTMQGE